METYDASDSTKSSPLYKADGVTTAERNLKKLCDHSFLSLWSYSNVYRDQGKQEVGGEGKEVCDLLVVFEDHVIIFSDKDCAFPDSGDLSLDWQRWFRRAVQKSAEQIWGAERWITLRSDRLFLDRACIQPFPFDLPEVSTMKVHRVIVAHGASDRCRKELGGSGSLMLKPDVFDRQQTTDVDERIEPFVIGQLDLSKGFVHIFDDTTLSIVLKTLDTIREFTTYLTQKEEFVLSGRLGAAAGEEELLAFYLQNSDGLCNHCFKLPPGPDMIFIGEGHWKNFLRSTQRRTQIEANSVSYAWDALIETFSANVIAGTLHNTSEVGLAAHEKRLRFLAREPRTRRRMLASSLMELMNKKQESGKAVRLVHPSNPGDPFYVFLLLDRDVTRANMEEYRKIRQDLLVAYCMVTKLKFPKAKDVIGIATETGVSVYRSEDIVHYDAREWSAEDKKQAEFFHIEGGLLKDISMSYSKEREFPLPDSVEKPKSWTPKRNWPCPCGSNRKYKKCCAPQ